MLTDCLFGMTVALEEGVLAPGDVGECLCVSVCLGVRVCV
jgi:hypothetical protein